jgi:hypothetical protein
VGTLAEAEELDRLTGCPPAGAGCVRVTFPFTLFPPITSDLESEIDPTQAGDVVEGFTVIVAEAVFAAEAVMVAEVGDDTVEVVTGKVPVVCPAGMVTIAGTLAAGLLLDNPTATPPAGAAEASVTVPVAL